MRRKPCCFRYFTIVFALFSVTVPVSSHLCVICCHFCCPMSLFQGLVACWNFTLTGPHMTVLLCESNCIQFIVEKFLLHHKVCNYCPSVSFSALSNNLIVIVFIYIINLNLDNSSFIFFCVISFCVVALNT